MNINSLILFFFIILILSLQSVLPVNLNPFLPYINSALSDSADSIFFNPSGISINRSFNLFLNLSYTDSKNSSIAFASDLFLGGFGYEEFELNTMNYKIYHYVLPGEIRISSHPIYMGIKSSWYTINESHPWSPGIGFLTRLYNIFSIGIVFDNLNRKEIYPDKSDYMETKLSLGLNLFKQHLLLSIENVGYKKFEWNNNIYQLLFEPIRGIRGYITYFSQDYKLWAGVNILFSHLSFGYYSHRDKKNTILYKHNSYQFSYSSESYPSFFRLSGVINIKVSGLITDTERFSFLGDISRGAQNIIEQIDKAIKDDKIKGMLLEIGGIETTSFGGIGGLIYEIREKIIEFRRRGKYVVAYLENGGSTEEYYLATAADKIVFAPYASLGELGISVKVRKFRGLLEKIGVKFDIITAGEDKNLFNPFDRDLTEKQKELIMKNVKDSYNLFIKAVAESRYLNEDEVETLINKNPLLTARTLKRHNWIDKTGYRKDAIETLNYLLERENSSEVNFIDIEDITYSKDKWKSLPKIAVVPIYGPVISGESIYNRLFGYIATGADTVIEQLSNIENDYTIKGIILRIDSPGGSISACDRIYRKLLELQDRGKFIVASFGSIAASGGYYIACGADKIVSTPFTITGSIGVFAMKPVLKDMFKKFDISSETIKKGEYSDLFTVDREFTEKERASIKKGMEEIYERFIRVVARSRDMSEDKVKDIAEGRIYTGNIAKQLNLVDRLGGIKEAVEIIKEEKDIDSPIMVYFWRWNKTWLIFSDG